MSDSPVIEGTRVRLRRAGGADLPGLVGIVRKPEVGRWWGPPPEGQVLIDEYLGEDTVTFAIEVDGGLIGLIQYHEENEPNFRSAGIDIALDPEHHGRGLGTDAVRAMARHLFETRDHHRLTIDPAADNAQAIACYRKVGFQPVGVMRQYTRLDGRWRDGLLMDLLREEFRAGAG